MNEESLLQRDKLRFHPAVLRALSHWWKEVADPRAEQVLYENYCVLYKRLMAELAPYLSASKVRHGRSL